jgi:hypothetical protein
LPKGIESYFDFSFVSVEADVPLGEEVVFDVVVLVVLSLQPKPKVTRKAAMHAKVSSLFTVRPILSTKELKRVPNDHNVRETPA